MTGSGREEVTGGDDDFSFGFLGLGLGFGSLGFGIGFGFLLGWGLGGHQSHEVTSFF